MNTIEKAREKLSEVFGFSEFRPGQKAILEAVLAGEDVLAIMPTGGGKSLCYQLPALLTEGVTVVVSPLISLMKDQVDSLVALGVPATFINSSLGENEMQNRLAALSAAEYRLVFVAPERFASTRFMDRLSALQVSLFAVDEAHCISQWGHDFRPAYTRLRRVRERLAGVQTIALTATATRRVQQDILTQLGMEQAQVFIAGFDRPNLFLKVDRIQDRMEGVINYIQQQQGMGIVYAGTRKNVEQVSESLKMAGIAALPYHAGLADAVRKKVQDDFIHERTRVIVATNAFGMGIDKPNIRFVLHFQMPGSIEAYYQEAGRAGRDGDPADCILFYSPEDRFLRERLIELSNPGLDIVLETWAQLEALREDAISPIAVTAEELAFRFDNEVHPRFIESALKFLVQTGYLAYITGSRQELLLGRPAEGSAETLPGEADFIEQLTSLFDAQAQWIRTSSSELAARFETEPRRIAALLLALQQKGLCQVHGPFERRGYILLKKAAPATWKRHLQERRSEAMSRLDDMVNYCQASDCRHAFFVRYFGEQVVHESCEACDNCTRELIASRENTVLAQKVLSCVVRMRENFGITAVAEVLHGSRSKRALRFRQLPTYGLLSGTGLDTLKQHIRAIQSAGYLMLTPGEYPVLKVTEKGWQVLRGQAEAHLPKLSEEKKRRAHSADDARVDAQLFDELRRVRLRLARGRDVPPYVIFPDRTLREMATFFPTTDADFRNIAGVGEVKMQTFVPHFQRAIKAYLARHRREAGEPPAGPMFDE